MKVGEPLELADGLFRRRVGGQDQPYRLVEGFESGRQAAADIRQATGLDERVGFTADEQDLGHGKVTTKKQGL